MSNRKYFFNDICAFKAGDMECMDIAKSEEVLEPQDENQKVEKLKESHLLLKKKLILSHELIKQYNDEINKCQKVGAELKAVKDNFEKITLQYNSSLAKTVKLELENKNYRQKIENFSKIESEQRTKIAADEQHLEQLKCKVRELEKKEIAAGKLKKEESLREKVKILETELKATKESHKLEIKQMEIKLKNLKELEVVKNQSKKKEIKISHEKATCTGNELEPVIVRPKTSEKYTLTNDFYSLKDDPYPLFCSKCINKLDPVPLDQILKQMSSCPAMITEVLSPSKESENNKPYTHSRASSRAELLKPEEAASHVNNLSQSLESVERNSDVSKSDFQRLERKLHLLERKLHKKMKKGIKEKSPCCGFPYANNCYLGSYPNVFQPGAMIRSQQDLFQFQNWQEGLRNRKRSRKISVQKPNRCGMKSRKRRKLDDGTSEWNVDSVPSRESIDRSDCTNDSENNVEPLNVPLRRESPPLQYCDPKNKPSRRPTENESCPPFRQKKREKLAALFAPLRSPSPKLRDDTEEEIHSETRIEESDTSRVVTESLSDEELIRNGTRTPEHIVEYETIECDSRKRGRGAVKATKTSSKRSLVTKIRNLKKNCNKVKPLVSKIIPANNNSKKLIGDQRLGPTVAIDEVGNNVTRNEPIKNDQVLNGIGDYYPATKQRIAHNARKSENDSLFETSKSLSESPKTNFQNDDVTNNTPIEKLDNCMEKIEIIGTATNPKPVRIQHKNNLRDSADIHSAKKPAVNYFEAEPVVEIMATGGIETESTINDTLNRSDSVVGKTLHDNGPVPLQPCVIIPKVYSDLEGVEDPREASLCAGGNEAEENESVTNLNLNGDRISSKDASLRTLRSKTKILKPNDKSLKNDGVNANEDVSAKGSVLIHSEAMSRTMKVELIRCSDNIQSPESPDNEISESMSDIHDTSMSVKSDKSEEVNNLETFENDKTVTVVACRKYKRRTRITAMPVSPMRELRSRRIILSPTANLDGKDSIKDGNDETHIESSSKIAQLSEDFNEGLSPRALIEQLLIKRANSQSQDFCYRKRVNEKLQQRKENLVLTELSKLVEDAEWTNAVLFNTIERLSKFKTHTIAKCIINFLVTKAEDNEKLDHTHTPPAPLLSKTQQRVLTMLVVLNRTIPNIVQLVQAGIEFRLFRLGHAPEVNVVTELARVFIALAKIQKDRERVRILCCDALYCLGLKAMPLIYVILTSWSEVLPIAGSNSDPLILCLIESIMTLKGDASFPKFLPLKKMLTSCYNYESSGYDSNALAKNLLTTLREKQQNGLDTAIILLAKRNGPVWTYKNIVQGGLLQMIIQNAHPSIYDAFCLLGHLMRSFPVNDNKGLVKNILEQLCALMESGEGSMQQQEGVATALLSLYRHKQNVVAKAILKWEPSEPLSEKTSRQLTALFNSHPPGWWNKLLRKNCTK